MELAKNCEIFKVSFHCILFNNLKPHENLNQSRVLEEMFQGEVTIAIKRRIK